MDTGTCTAATPGTFPALPSHPKVCVGVIPKPVTFVGVVMASAHQNQDNAAAFTAIAHGSRLAPPKDNPATTTWVVVI